jgi:hypothetical protein
MSKSGVKVLESHCLPWVIPRILPQEWHNLGYALINFPARHPERTIRAHVRVCWFSRTNYA